MRCGIVVDLAEALKENDIPLEYQPGEGAFYGPKIEFTLYDCLDRAWQCGTVQQIFPCQNVLMPPMWVKTTTVRHR